MPYVIGAACIDITDKSCIEECPVDCIYEGARKLYINPGECIDCGACEPVCPVEAITQDRGVTEALRPVPPRRLQRRQARDVQVHVDEREPVKHQLSPTWRRIRCPPR